MSGWTAATLNVSDEQTRDAIDSAMRELWSETDAWTAEGYAETTVQVERSAYHDVVTEELSQFFPQVEYIAIVSANDTSDSGYGTLFKVNDINDVEKVDEKQGYGGAKGRDVTGYFDEEHHVRSYASWEA